MKAKRMLITATLLFAATALMGQGGWWVVYYVCPKQPETRWEYRPDVCPTDGAWGSTFVPLRYHKEWVAEHWYSQVTLNLMIHPADKATLDKLKKAAERGGR